MSDPGPAGSAAGAKLGAKLQESTASSKIDDVMAALERATALDRAATPAAALFAPLARGQTRDVLSGRALGHALHPMLTDLPIGFWTSSLVLDIVGGRAGRAASRRFIALGLASVPLTAWAGWSDWVAAAEAPPAAPTGSDVPDVPAIRRVGIVHATLNGSATVAYAASYLARRHDRHVKGVALGLLGATLATAAGHLGGHLVLRLGVGVGRPSPPAPAASASSSPPASTGETRLGERSEE